VKKKILVIVIPRIISWLQRLIYPTFNVHVIGEDNIAKLRSEGKLWILSVWHAHALYAAIIHRKIPHGVMVSKSYDGDLISGVLAHFGHTPIRGSSSRGGKEALKGIIRCVKAGLPVSITPDGPKGPAEKIKPGIIGTAQLTGLPIIPFAYDASLKWVAHKAWDKHMIPKPFTRFTICYGEPIYVPKKMSPEEFASITINVEKAMDQAKERCRRKLNSAH
jgi:lysophospholipid acyltransferase (LPLAT)-like uncharacterized protein